MAVEIIIPTQVSQTITDGVTAFAPSENVVFDALANKQPTGSYATGTGTADGTNTGDETTATIKTKLGTASSTTDGYLLQTDWNTFNGKMPSIAIDTVPTNGSTNLIDSNAVFDGLAEKQATLVSGTNIKTINGTTILGSGDLVVGASSGVCGISNASGVYTYYATLTLAMTAASAGQTVELFSDITETGSVEITLKNGVNINGNGHTYTLNNSGTIHAFKAAASVLTSCNILNLTVIRSGSTASIYDNSCLVSLGVSTGIINCNGSKFKNLGSGCGILFSTNSEHSINFAVAEATTTYGAIGMFSSGQNSLNNSVGYGSSGGIGIRCHTGGSVQNCTGYSDSGHGFYGLAGTHSNCIGISVSGTGFYSASTSVSCIGRSTSGFGFESGGVSALHCVGISTSSAGIYLQNTVLADHCTGISSSNYGIRIASANSLFSCTAKSTSSAAIWQTNGTTTKLHDCNIISDYNNAVGYGIVGNAGNFPGSIICCNFKLSNASAPYLYDGVVAKSIQLVKNVYSGGGAFNANITNSVTNVEDSQGNIYL